MRVTLPETHKAGSSYAGESLAPEIVGAARAFGQTVYQQSRLSLREIEAARYRTAQINGCNGCMAFRGARDLPVYFDRFGGDVGASVHARGAAPDEALYENVGAWRDWPGYSERERLAICYAEGLGQDPHGIAQDEEFWARAKAAFSDAEIVDLSYSIASWIAAGRVAHALGLDGGGVCAVDPVAEAEPA
jgi:alkylhydroperoxidase family enzyme